ncbi:ribonucleases P/MRP protein subunit pop7 [Blastocladiella emersonii ATCC 22665]|nr:ribonucleases P/MRP protein subunit pop7 [Blastocladiella emersonii ATCC 22665]
MLATPRSAVAAATRDFAELVGKQWVQWIWRLTCLTAVSGPNGGGGAFGNTLSIHNSMPLTPYLRHRARAAAADAESRIVDRGFWLHGPDVFNAPMLARLFERVAPCLPDDLTTADMSEWPLTLLAGGGDGNDFVPTLSHVKNFYLPYQLALYVTATGNGACLILTLDFLASDKRFLQHNCFESEHERARMTIVEVLALACLKWWRPNMLSIVTDTKYGFNVGQFRRKLFHGGLFKLMSASCDQSLPFDRIISTLKWFLVDSDEHDTKRTFSVALVLCGKCGGPVLLELFDKFDKRIYEHDEIHFDHLRAITHYVLQDRGTSIDQILETGEIEGHGSTLIWLADLGLIDNSTAPHLLVLLLFTDPAGARDFASASCFSQYKAELLAFVACAVLGLSFSGGGNTAFALGEDSLDVYDYWHWAAPTKSSLLLSRLDEIIRLALSLEFDPCLVLAQSDCLATLNDIGILNDVLLFIDAHTDTFRAYGSDLHLLLLERVDESCAPTFARLVVALLCDNLTFDITSPRSDFGLLFSPAARAAPHCWTVEAFMASLPCRFHTPALLAASPAIPTAGFSRVITPRAIPAAVTNVAPADLPDPAWKPWQCAIRVALTKIPNTLTRAAIQAELRGTVFSSESLIMADFLCRGELLTDKRVKKNPVRASPSPIDIYVTTDKTTPVRAYLARARKMLDTQGENFVVIHGLGKAIERAALVATMLQEQYLGAATLEVTTDTVRLADELDYENEDLEPEMDVRQSSAIHVRVAKKAILSSALQGVSAAASQAERGAEQQVSTKP